jgi:hypothetical protein
VKNPKDDHDEDLFLQYHHDVYRYLVAVTLDDNWQNSAKVEPDPKNASQFKVTVGPEVLTVAVVDESPADVQAKGEHHWAVTNFVEIDPHSPDRGNSGPLEAAIGGGKMLGMSDGAAKQIRDIAGMGSHAKKPLWAAKMELIPLINNPRAAGLDYHIIDLFPHRTDPAVKFCLQRVVDDGRYPATSRERAKKVIDGTLDMDTEGAVRGLE